MTTPTLEALTERVRCLEQVMEEKFCSADDAISLARDNMERRLEGINEFREQLNAQTHTFTTKVENDLKMAVIEERIAQLDKRVQGVELIRADLQGRFWTLTIVLGVAIVVMEAILHLVIKGNFPK